MLGLFAMFAVDETSTAQDTAAPEIPEAPETPIPDTMPDIELPFIDRDSDGINDLVQSGWGLRFAERYKKRQDLWNRLNVEIVRDEDGRMVDTNGDGDGDISVHDFMMEKMNELVDSDGDGEKDTPLREYLGGRFKSFDQNGDGLPDDLTAEEVRERMNEMRAWRQEIRERIHKGEAAFTDDDGDGIPDNLPMRYKKRGNQGGPMNGRGGIQ